MSEFFLNILGDITAIIEQYNYLIIFVLMAVESSFIPFPSEIIMIPAGFLVAQGKLSLTLVILTGTFGALAGALINYYLAKHLGYKFLHKYGKYVLISHHNLEKMNRFF